ncbi:hypothetical protein Acsp03_36370 [Actinomadura sp. NBRC 104412]|nr:hypothetical protein Acsp03_36370 [Actinomadura sp. NBRC 104412]
MAPPEASRAFLSFFAAVAAPDPGLHGGRGPPAPCGNRRQRPGTHVRHTSADGAIHLRKGQTCAELAALPGSTYDLTAARIWGVLRVLEAAGLLVLADKTSHAVSCQAAATTARAPLLTPYRGKGKPEPQRTPTVLTPGSVRPARIVPERGVLVPALIRRSP